MKMRELQKMEVRYRLETKGQAVLIEWGILGLPSLTYELKMKNTGE